MSTIIVPHVKVNVLYPIWSLYLLFLFNLVPNLPIFFIIYYFCLKLTNFVPIEDVTKFNFYIKVIMM